MAPSERSVQLASRLDGTVALELDVLGTDVVAEGLRALHLGGDLTGFEPLPGQDLMVLVSDGETERWRRYTVRSFAPGSDRLSLWISSDTPGPGSRLVNEAAPGDSLELVGPRGKVHLDPDADWHIFCVDSSGLAAAYNMVEALGPDAAAIVVAAFEPVEIDVQPRLVDGLAFARYRAEPDEDGESLCASLDLAIAECTPNLERTTAYVFCEMAVMRRVIEQLAGSLPSERIRSKAYWRRGRANQDHGEPERA